MGRLFALLLVPLIAILQSHQPVAAQDWPTRSMTMTVAFPAGGSDDILGRIIASRLSEILGQQVTVENTSGGGGTTGTARVAKAAPDGYQFMLGTSATHALSQVLRQNPVYNAATDFAPVGLIAEQPFVLIARKDLPESLPAFIAYAKANAAKMQYGSAGEGSATHLVCTMFDTAIGVNAKHVPYNGGAPALQDLLAGKIDYFCPVVTIAIPQIQNKGVNAVAILSKNRTPVLPNLASASEQGLTNFSASTWFALFLPKGTPAPIVQRLHAAISATLETPVVQAKLKEIGTEIVSPDRRSPEYLQTFLKGEIDKWAGAIKAADIKVD